MATINSIISENDNSILINFQTCINAANNISLFYKNAKEISQRLDSVFIELQDLANETEILSQDSNPSTNSPFIFISIPVA